ncbi:MAG: hypothetical protein FJW96_15055 [Actinobacteria bacterium]|nr:hypothetical protein [Actinomycetota bacterium]MBM3679170.1 hypothetical protein [Actinomycetota bacterium]
MFDLAGATSGMLSESLIRVLKSLVAVTFGPVPPGAPAATLGGAMFVYDFTPVAQPFAAAREVLAADPGGVVAEAIRAATAGDRGNPVVRVDVGPPREREEAVVVTLAWGEPLQSVGLLEGDLELAPLGPGLSHLSLSANYRPARRELARRLDEQRDRRSTEALVREFLVSLARRLERAGGPPQPTPRRQFL